MQTALLQGSTEQFEIRKIICIGRNYADHAKEMNAEVPKAPVFFLKPPTAIIGNGGTIIIPPISDDLHHEVEMTFLLGKGGRNVAPADAMEYVAGYGIGLDMTLRDVQAEAKKKGLPWTLAKGFDTSAPLSSFVHVATVPDPHALNVTLAVNGTIRQQSSTRNFIFKIDTLISYISQFITLEPGDIFFTGTPEGVARAVSGDKLEATLSSSAGATLASLSVQVR
ncbi:MAG: fumarylacetoacetate hydrolase family protein [Bacteroidota bacterium]